MADIFYNALKQDAAMIKGDTMQFGFIIKGLAGATPEMITYTCKKSVEDNTALFAAEYPNEITQRSYDPENDILFYVVRIPPAFTENVQPGRYFYDLEMRVNSDVITLLKGRLDIETDITN